MRIFATKNRKRNASIKEYKCIIRIGCKENSGGKPSPELNAKLKGIFAAVQSCHDIEDYIKQQFSQNILDDRPVKAYITAYREKQDTSFVIDFTILVLTAIENYDEIHDILEKRLQELSGVFTRILGESHLVRYTLLQSGTVAVDEKIAISPSFIRYALFLITGLLVLLVGLVVSPGITREKQTAQLRSIVKEELENYRELQKPSFFHQNIKCNFHHKYIGFHKTKAGIR